MQVCLGSDVAQTGQPDLEAGCWHAASTTAASSESQTSPLLSPKASNDAETLDQGLVQESQGWLDNFEVSALLVQIIFAVGPVCADFLTDYGIALPQLHEQRIDLFQMQAAVLAVAWAFGAICYAVEQKTHTKLRVDAGTTCASVIGMLLVFPLLPFSILLEAVVAWAQGNAGKLNSCILTAQAVCAAEVLEAVLSLALQAEAAYTGVKNLQVSLIVGCCCVVKVAIEHNLVKKTYLCIQMCSSNADDLDISIPIVTGPLAGLAESIWRSILLAVHYLQELVAGICCILLFHHAAHDYFQVQISYSGSCSVAWLVSLGGQAVLLFPVIMLSIPMEPVRAMQAAITSAFFAPLPILDADLNVIPFYVVRIAAQLLMIVFTFTKLALVTSAYLRVGAVAALTGMILTLLLIRTCAATRKPDASQREALDAATRAVKNKFRPVLPGFRVPYSAQLESFIDVTTTSVKMPAGAHQFDKVQSRSLASKELAQKWHDPRGLLKGIGLDPEAEAYEVSFMDKHGRTMTPTDCPGGPAADAFPVEVQVAPTSGTCVLDEDPTGLTMFSLALKYNSLQEEARHHFELCLNLQNTLSQLEALPLKKDANLKIENVRSELGPKGCQHLAKLTQLASLSLGGNNNLGPEGCQHLAKLTQLASLSLGDANRLGPEGCQHLAKLTQLASLSLGCDNGLGTEGCQHLAKLTQLASLSLGDRNDLALGRLHLAKLTQTRLNIG